MNDRVPYEKPEARVVDLGHMLDEAVGILQDSARSIEGLQKSVENILADIENIQALHTDASQEIEQAEALMVKIQRILEVKNGSEPATQDQ